MSIEKLPVKVKRPQAGELAKRIHEMINEYSGEIGLAEALGALEIVKFQLIDSGKRDLSGG